MQSKEIDSLSMSDSVADLERLLSLLENGGRYNVVCKKTKDQTKALCETVYEHINPGAETSTVSGPGLIPAGYMTAADVEKRLFEARQQWIMEDEMKRLREKVTELEKEKKEIQDSNLGAAIGNTLKTVQPFLPDLMKVWTGKTIPATVGVNGFPTKNKGQIKDTTTMADSTNTKYVAPTTQTPPTDEEAQARCQAALYAWQAADPQNFLRAVEKIAEIAANDPAKYNTYIPFIIG